MKTSSNEITQLSNTRTLFVETLSQQFIALTGCGVYVYLNPVDISGLFNQYLSDTLSINTFARQCVKNVLE
ncbi:hypothetical protein ACH5Y9_12345 [Methylomonas sp. BW4-1]|uniref:Uncharacterized protein n=1 Tax=Methylomonas defluvii TaxID=3045149 RepID=A0ABU4UJC3_9GAMM|nr:MULTISPECIES: hypothetical protein [unclassified Methylomonas]MDX8129480.1 hypothetical protein [Methylomonas sp. OY6]NOV28845.1 hypothetical protein [Methylomonas sp. ZR1]PKD41132.1 hypothetical protein CWO84_06875 [Methylomonas sp. Kb3]QBC27042.1 hypothetical protein U737_09055 [Methylomonas sp. LW13]QSB02922.1 hypothetical protein JWZ98_08310 [Methylomonas sp. EFPC1]